MDKNYFFNLEKKYIQDRNIKFLNNSSFNKGTFRITEPGIYRLTENIKIEPNSDFTCFPMPKQQKYPSRPGPYILGFFAGITIETNNVILDLNSFTLQQSIRFYLLQRFFSLIELANSPFIIKQGPGISGNFGLNYQSAEKTWIKNGNLGLSSHHGIHGNGCKDILITDLKINNFEVSGIAINGVHRLVVESCIIQNSMGTKLKVPVNGRFSAVVYLWRNLENLIKLGHGNYKIQIGQYNWNIEEAFTYWSNIINKTVKQVNKSNLYQLPQFDKEIQNLFGNPGGFQDCSAIYGILIHKLGVAIHDFGCCKDSVDAGQRSSDIVIHKCSILNIAFKPRELVGLLDSKKRIQVDFSNSLIMLLKPDWMSDYNAVNNRFSIDTPFVNTDGNFDKILATQVMLYKASQDLVIKWAEGVAKISPEIIKWVEIGNQKYQNINKTSSIRNGDIMAHVMKGVIAIRLDYVNNCTISKCVIEDINNLGSKALTGNILGSYIDGDVNLNSNNIPDLHLGHLKSNDYQKGYTGNFTRGISLIESNNIEFESNTITRLSSLNGSSIGVDFMYANNDCFYNKNLVSYINSGIKGGVHSSSPNISLPNWIQRSIGVCIGQVNQNISGQYNTIEKLTSNTLAEAFVCEAGMEQLYFSILGQKNNEAETFKLMDGLLDTIKK